MIFILISFHIIIIIIRAFTLIFFFFLQKLLSILAEHSTLYSLSNHFFKKNHIKLFILELFFF